MTKFHNTVLKELQKVTKLKDIILEVPPNPEMGELSFPCFQLSKKKKLPPNQIAEELLKKIIIKRPINKIKVIGPYLNFYVHKPSFAKEIIEQILKEKDKYGSQNIGKNKTIIIDYSSPNIAKPFGIGHLRSTVIGNSIKKTLEFVNYKCVGVNHLGDWGTQFGKLIYAYNTWGPPLNELKKAPLTHLYSLYVKFHQESKLNPDLDEKGREWFKKLEDGDPKAIRLWELFRSISLKEFQKYYKELNITFDTYSGEAFYNQMLEPTIKLIKKKKITEISDNALIVPLTTMPPLLLRKSDGATTYATRDLAAALFRIKEYKPQKILYVVGTPQKLHFQQLFTTLSKLNNKPGMFEHIEFGLLKFKEGKMSTREGNIIFLEDVLDKSIQLAKKTIQEKNPHLKNKDKVSKIVGIGAVIFADLNNDRIRDIIFDWDKILSYEGETGPYIQYSYARICSILRKAKVNKLKTDYKLLTQPEEHKLIKLLEEFPETINNSVTHYKPHIIARYTIDLAQAFNEFYHKCPIIQSTPELQKVRLELIKATQQVIKTSMNLLGIELVKEM